MDKALYIAMSGAKELTLSQNARANNLANVNTTGFKHDFAQARAMQVYADYPHYATRAYAMSERPATSFEQGPLVQTGNALDLAVEGEGWIAVQNANGEEAYTRAGNLFVDVNGQVRTGAGLQVLGQGGPLVVPPSTTVEIGVDGTVSVLADGAVGLAQIDQIKLVNPDTQTLEKREDGLIYSTEGEADQDINVRVRSGFLEGSNVNAVNEMTELLAIQRQYEMQVKMMSTANEMSEASARLLQFS
jgi:flagellar basal-body rod protein FlgF